MPTLTNASEDTLVVNRRSGANSKNLVGTLTDKNRAGIIGAEIIFCKAETTVRTDSSGEFDTDVIPSAGKEYGAEVTNNARRPLITGSFIFKNGTEGEPAGGTVKSAAGDRLEIIEGAGTGTLSGKVVDRNSNAIQGVKVFLCNLSEKGVEVTTDGTGAFNSESDAAKGVEFFVRATINSGSKQRQIVGVFTSN